MLILHLASICFQNVGFNGVCCGKGAKEKLSIVRLRDGGLEGHPCPPVSVFQWRLDLEIGGRQRDALVSLQFVARNGVVSADGDTNACDIM